MNIVESYYIRKSRLNHNDDYHSRIEQCDIELLRKAQIYMLLAPAFTLGLLYLAKELRQQVMMSQHFFFVIKKMQERFQAKY